jgi:hypothetical protein
VRLYTVLFAEFGLLIRREASEEGVKVWDHGFVLLDNLWIISTQSFIG